MDLTKIESSVKRSRWFVAIVFGVTVISYVFWFFLVNNKTLSTSSADWGTFGDFIGGLLNPLIAYSAFYWLTVSVLVQKQELAETKNALIESSRAQKEQVQIAKKREKIELLKLKIEQLDIELNSEISYQDYCLRNGYKNGGFYPVLDIRGKTSNVLDQLESTNNRIQTLKVEKNLLIQDMKLLFGNDAELESVL